MNSRYLLRGFIWEDKREELSEALTCIYHLISETAQSFERNKGHVLRERDQLANSLSKDNPLFKKRMFALEGPKSTIFYLEKYRWALVRVFFLLCNRRRFRRYTLFEIATFPGTVLALLSSYYPTPLPLFERRDATVIIEKAKNDIARTLTTSLTPPYAACVQNFK